MAQVQPNIRIGTAAWSIPKTADEYFPSEGSHLERYAATLNAVEINSSFYREHQASTYRKWAQMVPDDFQFAVKLAKKLTHLERLRNTAPMAEILEGIFELGKKLGVILVQLPPSLQFETVVAEKFFAELRKLFPGPIAFEPRHATWVTNDALKLLSDYKVSKVIADPTVITFDETHDCHFNNSFCYVRLHGAPKIYYSDYEKKDLERWGNKLKTFPTQTTWCICDNTALGYATRNAVFTRRFIDISKNFRGSSLTENMPAPSLEM